ncbi:MAG: hypothetical protein ABIK61_06535 [candidate division WOR-3 bacterium]
MDKINNKDKKWDDMTLKVSNSGNNKGKNKIISMLNAIETKPFIILSGISGTGKTQIARIISACLVTNTNNNKIKE